MNYLYLSLAMIFMTLPITNASSINLNEISDAQVTETELSPAMEKINAHPLTQAFIADYEKIGFVIDNSSYIINIQEDKIVSIEPKENLTGTDYVISTDMEEIMQYITDFDGGNAMTLIAKFLFEKDIPLKVKWRVLKVAIQMIGEEAS